MPLLFRSKECLRKLQYAFGDSHDLQFAVGNAKECNYPKFLFDSKEEAEEYIRAGKIPGYDEHNARVTMDFV